MLFFAFVLVAASARLLPTVDTIIVGAGGGGLQAALLLQKAGMSYVVLDRAAKVGSFWSSFPVFGELISINKWVRNKTQAMRFDWHSLLGAPITMLDVTNDYFPRNTHVREYYERVVSGARLNIVTDMEVLRTHPTRPCVVLRGEISYCARKRVLVATGLAPKQEPILEALGGIPYQQFRRHMAFRRRVCILGNGNSGFEVAQNTYDVAERVTIYGKRPFRLSAVSRYTGDVRTKLIQVVENLHGKLLDTVSHFVTAPSVKLRGFNLSSLQTDEMKLHMRTAAWLNQYECETFVIATGFHSQAPGVCLPHAFPNTKDWFVDPTNPNLHYIGWLMHERDFRVGAGGFLSGYRYLIRNLVAHFRELDQGVPFPRHLLTTEKAVAHIIHRCQTGDDILIMQDGVIIRDVILPTGDGLWYYYDGVPYQMMPELQHPDAIHLYFSWGDCRGAAQVFDSVYRYSNTKRLVNLFLHPVLETRGVVRHILEDLEMAWRHEPYVQTIVDVAREALSGNTSHFLPRSRYPFKHCEMLQTEQSDVYAMPDLRSTLDNGVAQSIVRAIVDSSPSNLESLHNRMKQWMPALFEMRS